MRVHKTAGELNAGLRGWRLRGHEIIFESDTPAGKSFDVALIAAILVSTTVVLLDSMAEVRAQHRNLLVGLEWAMTLIFTVEYLLRLSCVSRPARYARSFFGIVDLLSIIPTYLSLAFPGVQVLAVVRLLRILRVFRVLKLAHYVAEAEELRRALVASRRKVAVFLFSVLALVVIFGSIMYVVEGPENGFSSIPRGIYWAIVTMTTVGYGDISPQTNLGQSIASLIMILGYGIIAIPTGIVSAELISSTQVSGQACSHCLSEGHAVDARYCKNCGAAL